MSGNHGEDGIAAARLDSYEDVFRKIFHSVNDAIFIHDAESGEILDVNETACEMYGYTRREMRQLTVEELSSGTQPYTQRTADEHLQAAAAGEPQVFDWRATDSDGNDFWVEVSMRRTTLDGETLILVIGRDVTDRKEHEQKLERANEQLRILNRIVRHDIRNDMTVAVGWSKELEEYVDAEGRPMLDQIQNTTRHVIEMTKTVRDFIETLGTDQVAPLKPTNLRDQIEAEVTWCRSTYPEAELSIEGEIPRVTVLANELLSSVFRNLLNNAVEHNDKDEPRVEVSVVRNDDSVTVRVADNGPGIPDDQKEAIFGRSDDGLDDPACGIGLYLVDMLVSEYGGEVWVENNRPVGSIFSVKLDLASESDSDVDNTEGDEDTPVGE